MTPILKWTRPAALAQSLERSISEWHQLLKKIGAKIVDGVWVKMGSIHSYIGIYIFQCGYDFSQGILKGEVSLYHWPPVWLVWISLFWQIKAKFVGCHTANSKPTGGQWYSDTSPFSIPCFSHNFSVLRKFALVTHKKNYRILSKT